MTNFEKITQSPEALGEFLSRFPVLEGRGTRSFREIIALAAGA